MAPQTRIHWLDWSATFRDFNCFDGPLAIRPTQAALGEWIHEARTGSSLAATSFAEAMYWTLRPAAFEAYLRLHPETSATYDDWFHSKVRFFLRVLLDSDPSVPFSERPKKGLFRVPDYSDAFLPPEAEQFLEPEDNERLDWHELVEAVSQCPQDRVGALMAWLKRTPDNAKNESPATARRNGLIREGARAGKSRREVCEHLDRHGVPTTAAMRKMDLLKWTAAFDDPEFKPNVQTMISKAVRPIAAVKASTVSQ